MIYHCAVTAWSCLSDHNMCMCRRACASACACGVCRAGGEIYWGEEVSIPHPGCEIHVGLWWFVQMEWGHRLWKPNAIWLEVNRKAIFSLPQCAERKKEKERRNYLLFFIFFYFARVGESEWDWLMTKPAAWCSFTKQSHHGHNWVFQVRLVKDKILKNAQTTKQN